MDAATPGWLNFALLALSSVFFSVLYAMSVQPARLERRIGAKAYGRCGLYRWLGSVGMLFACAAMVAYRWYPVPFDPFPARFPWPYWGNLIGAVVLGVPTSWVFIRGVRDAGRETMSPDKSHTLYRGIYEKIRHPQALGEAPMWIWIGLLLDSPFITVASLLYLPVWYWWCVVEERDLLLRYGESYAAYRARTGMFWPR